ncbi:hypothetical protein D3Y55_21025 [Mesorhizobium sp. DCY119]|nr:hypothetical protein D3Y55_21025 [Mesorhizobium sp. DCY119]
MLRAVGLTEAEIEGDLKEAPSVRLAGKTPRHAMQTLGTEWGRNCMGEDFWVGIWRQRVEAIIEVGGRVIVDDCRFPNEAATIRRLGGDIYRLDGRGGISGSHESERANFIADLIVTNDGSREELHDKLDEALGRWA